MIGAELALSLLYGLPQWDQLLATLDQLPDPTAPGPAAGTAEDTPASLATDLQGAWTGEFVTPTQTWGPAAALLALHHEVLSTAEALRHEVVAALSALLHSPWVGALTGALVAGEVYRRRARRAGRQPYPAVGLPEVDDPSGLT
jgi:hypothetical protein